jgi:hypothetical protein
VVLPNKTTTAEGNMQLTDIRRRVKRLEQLTKGLAKEVSIIRAADGPLLDRERKQYRASIQDALAGADAARVILARVVQRMVGADLASQLPERS